MQNAAGFRRGLRQSNKQLDRSELKGTITMNLMYAAAFSLFVGLSFLERLLT